MAEKEIVITYDVLYDFLRREKNNGEIQNLGDDFLRNVAAYLEQKQALMKENTKDSGIFGLEEKRKLLQQLENVHKMLSDLYDWREKKIVAMARDVSRTDSSIADTSALLEPEKKLYQEVLDVLNRFRKDVLGNLLLCREIETPVPGALPEPDKGQEGPKALNTNVELSATEGAVLVKIRFRESVPPFMGPDMKEYGPFDLDDVKELPEEIAGLMMQKGCAEKVEN